MSYEDREAEEWRERERQYAELERQRRYAELADQHYENFGRDSDAAYNDWASHD
jgi:hypothetical protein